MHNSASRIWLISLISNASILLLGIVSGIVTARLLLPEGRGALAAVLFWPQLIATIGILSLPQAITYSTGQGGFSKGTLLVTSTCLVLGLAVVTGIIGYFFLPLLMNGDRTSLLPITQYYFLFFLPFNFLSLSLLSVDHGFLHLTRFNLIRLIGPISYLVGLIGLWLMDGIKVESVVWVNFAGTFLTVLICFVGLWSVRLERFSWPLAQKILITGWHYHMATLLFVVASQIDRVVVLGLLNNKAVGLYIVAFTVGSSAFSIITSTFYTVLFPKIANQENPEMQRTLLANGLRYASLAITGIALPLMLLAPWYVPLLFGNSFKDAIVPSVVLLLANIPFCLRQIIVHSFRGMGVGLPATIAEGLALILFLLMSFPMVRVFGLSGIGIALLLANLTAMSYLTFYLKTRMGLPITDWWGLNTSTLIESTNRIRIFVSQGTLYGK